MSRNSRRLRSLVKKLRFGSILIGSTVEKGSIANVRTIVNLQHYGICAIQIGVSRGQPHFSIKILTRSARIASLVVLTFQVVLERIHRC